ncbi:P-loop containing nucleoside triphosphate hydrolase protein [Tuber borchii]|uniref:P-loop containing nucleoside triphosphate hydrolase protein n=1 Tax=Tuber borchii TaxID=42251 RepID=A0A2T6ZM64_TUBBO|nr:P-loop containing nucleoside triphosphate hydrolase protein [Tuber borchii]
MESKVTYTKDKLIAGGAVWASPAPRKRRERTPDEDDKSAKRQKGKDSCIPPKSVSLKDIGGMEDIVDHLARLTVVPLVQPQVYQHIGVQPRHGILLHGPPGCGKTLLVNAIAGEFRLVFFNVSAHSIKVGRSGEPEKKIKRLFEEAQKKAPCLIFVDEIDALTQKRDNMGEGIEGRLVTQMISCMEDLTSEKTAEKHIIIIGATNQPESLDPAFRRAGMFDREIRLNMPDEAAREKILKVVCEGLRLARDLDFKELAKKTHGFVGRDLSALAQFASVEATRRFYKFKAIETPSVTGEPSAGTSVARLGDLANISMASGDSHPPLVLAPAPVTPQRGSPSSTQYSDNVPMDASTGGQQHLVTIKCSDFLTAVKQIEPICKKAGWGTVVGVMWADIGGIGSLRLAEMRMAIVEPIRNPDFLASLGIIVPTGTLLWGPPGCGKTLLAKAAINESRAKVITIWCPELLNKDGEEAERLIGQMFSRAQSCTPCVIFFEDLDHLLLQGNSNLSESSSRAVNSLLSGLDSVKGHKGIYVIGATNRPDFLDPAMLTPGRFENIICVEPPDANERLEILKTLTKKTILVNVDLQAIAADPRCVDFSRKSLEELVEAATTQGFLDASLIDENPIIVTDEHFEMAFAIVLSAVTEEE